MTTTKPNANTQFLFPPTHPVPFLALPLFPLSSGKIPEENSCKAHTLSLEKKLLYFPFLFLSGKTSFGANSLQCFTSLGQSPLSPPYKEPDTTHNNRQHIRTHTVLIVTLDFINLGQLYFLCYHNVFGELLDSIRSQ